MLKRCEIMTPPERQARVYLQKDLKSIKFIGIIKD